MNTIKIILLSLQILKLVAKPDTIDAVIDAVEVKNPAWIPLMKIVRLRINVPDDDIDQANPT